MPDNSRRYCIIDKAKHMAIPFLVNNNREIYLVPKRADIILKVAVIVHVPLSSCHHPKVAGNGLFDVLASN